MIERSLAIKSPTIHYHLAGTKKVQQALADPGVLERFVLKVLFLCSYECTPIFLLDTSVTKIKLI